MPIIFGKGMEYQCVWGTEYTQDILSCEKVGLQLSKPRVGEGFLFGLREAISKKICSYLDIDKIALTPSCFLGRLRGTFLKDEKSA